MSILYENFKNDVLNELYIGDASLDKAQMLLSELRSEIKDSNAFSRIGKLTSGKVSEFNREIEKCFGFKIFNLSINSSIGSQNIYTIPINGDTLLMMRSHKDLVLRKNGKYYFNPNLKIAAIVFISVDILLNEDLSDREVMALILREIGNLFVLAMNNQLLTLNTACLIMQHTVLLIASLGTMAPLNLTHAVIGSNFWVRLKNYIDSFIVKNIKFAKDITLAFRYVMSIINYLPKKMFKMLTTPLYNVTVQFDPIGSLVTYRFKEFGNKFASVYGYASEISTATTKIEYDTDIRLKRIESPIVAYSLGFLNTAINLPISLITNKPNPIGVARDQLDYLETELKRNNTLEPAAKKQIQNQIDDITEFIDKEYYSNPKMDINTLNKKASARINEIFGADPSKAILRLISIGVDDNRELDYAFDDLEEY